MPNSRMGHNGISETLWKQILTPCSASGNTQRCTKRGASWREKTGGDSRRRKQEGRHVSSYFLGHHGAGRDDNQMDLLWGIFHTTTAHYFGIVSWLHLTIRVQMCAGSLWVHPQTHVGSLDSSLALCPWTTKNFFCVFPWLILTQLWLADNSLGLANLPVHIYWGRQVADQMPSSSAL